MDSLDTTPTLSTTEFKRIIMRRKAVLPTKYQISFKEYVVSKDSM